MYASNSYQSAMKTYWPGEGFRLCIPSLHLEWRYNSNEFDVVLGLMRVVAGKQMIPSHREQGTSPVLTIDAAYR